MATVADQPRASLSLAESDDGGLSILADAKPVGSISATDAPVTLTPRPVDPRYAGLESSGSEPRPTPRRASRRS